MKKIISFLLLLMSGGLLYGADLRNFEIIMGGANPEIAGVPIPVTVRAIDTEGSLKNDYAGIAGFQDTGGGQIIVEETGTTLTQAFTSGIWEGKIQILRADNPVTIVLTDVSDASGATGTATKNIAPGNYSKLKLIIEGMTFAPGTITGHTGTWVTQTTGALTPAYVTVYACDAYYNTVNVNLPVVGVSSLPPPKSIISPSFVDFAEQGVSSAIFSVALVPSPDQSGGYPITAEDKNQPIIKDVITVYFASLTDFYFWAEAPGVITAGQSFTVSVKVSHFPPPNASYVAGFNDAVCISAIDTYGNSTTIPALLPDANPLQSCIDGEANFLVSYTWAGQIRIKPDNCGTTKYSNEDNPDRYSNVINILSASPSSFTFETDKDRIKTGRTAVLTATIYDAYMNPVSNTAVDFSIIEGAGTLNTINAKTNTIGIAKVIFTAPASNTRTTIQATVPDLSQSKTVRIDSQLTENFETWPNPFNPNKGSVKINFPLESECRVKVEIFTVFGQKLWVKEIDGIRGGNTVLWDGRVDDGYVIGSGLYVIRISYTDSTGSHTMTRKIAVIK